jgi:hypothetical protein
LLRITTCGRIEPGIHGPALFERFALPGIGAFLKAQLALQVEFLLLRSRRDPLP